MTFSLSCARFQHPGSIGNERALVTERHTQHKRKKKNDKMESRRGVRAKRFLSFHTQTGNTLSEKLEHRVQDDFCIACFARRAAARGVSSDCGHSGTSRAHTRAVRPSNTRAMRGGNSGTMHADTDSLCAGDACSRDPDSMHAGPDADPLRAGHPCS